MQQINRLNTFCLWFKLAPRCNPLMSKLWSHHGHPYCWIVMVQCQSWNNVIFFSLLWCCFMLFHKCAGVCCVDLFGPLFFDWIEKLVKHPGNKKRTTDWGLVLRFQRSNMQLCAFFNGSRTTAIAARLSWKNLWLGFVPTCRNSLIFLHLLQGNEADCVFVYWRSLRGCKFDYFYNFWKLHNCQVYWMLLLCCSVPVQKNPPKWGTISGDNFCSGCGLYIWWSTFEVPMEQQSWELDIEFWNTVFAFKRSYMTTIVYNSIRRMSSWMQG